MATARQHLYLPHDGGVGFMLARVHRSHALMSLSSPMLQPLDLIDLISNRMRMTSRRDS